MSFPAPFSTGLERLQRRDGFNHGAGFLGHAGLGFKFGDYKLFVESSPGRRVLKSARKY